MRKIKYAFAMMVIFSTAVSAANTPAPPKDKKLTLQDLINSSGTYSSKTTSVAGVRGLEEVNGEIDTQARDFAAVERLEQIIFHEDELQRFRDEGKLH